MPTNENFRSTQFIDFFFALMITALLIFGYKYLESIHTKEIPAPRKKSITYKFGFNTDSVHMENHYIQESDLVGDILSYQGIGFHSIAELENKAKSIFSVRKIRSGKKYHLVKDDECGELLSFIYEPNPLQYVQYDFRDSVSVKLVNKKVDVCHDIAAGTINSSLWVALEEQNVSPHIIDLMEDALSGSVDFYNIKKGDEFKLIYEKKFVENKSVGLGKVIGAYFKNSNGEHYSYYYNNDKYSGYYDDEGRPVTGTFLLAPIKSSYRVSSGYNLRRFHPIKKRRIPHLGTDYAAPYGTPIISVADGVVEAASYGQGNGRYVKIRHDRVYQTQYLHMQRFGKGIKPGKRVKQGQVIGYVGSTGLATGPHVCFRFWKNGKQINHRREVFPPADPMPDSELQNYFKVKNEIKELLNIIPSDTEPITPSIQT